VHGSILHLNFRRLVGKALVAGFILGLAGCASVQPGQYTASPCSASEASYECQIERYNNVNVQ
jgi:hypothetical protein